MKTIFASLSLSLFVMLAACGGAVEDVATEDAPPAAAEEPAATPEARGLSAGRTRPAAKPAPAPVPTPPAPAPVPPPPPPVDECAQTTDSQVLCYGTVWPAGATSHPYACTNVPGCALNAAGSAWCCP